MLFIAVNATASPWPENFAVHILPYSVISGKQKYFKNMQVVLLNQLQLSEHLSQPQAITIFKRRARRAKRNGPQTGSRQHPPLAGAESPAAGAA